MKRRKGGKEERRKAKGAERTGEEQRQEERERETKKSKRGRKSMAQRGRIVAELEDKNKKNGSIVQWSRAKEMLRSRAWGLQQGCVLPAGAY